MKDNKERFIELLKSTQREGIDYVLDDLEDWGFYTAPASSNHHYNYDGGLLEHSLNVYDMAIRIREQIISLRPDLEKELPVDSVIIASLLHDVCKTDIYFKRTRKRKNEAGAWEAYECYEVDYSNLPIGHGEKSVILLLRSGLDINEDEMLAIRWHMAPWDLPFQSLELCKSVDKARHDPPLCTLVQCADGLAANILEMDIKVDKL